MTVVCFSFRIIDFCSYNPCSLLRGLVKRIRIQPFVFFAPLSSSLFFLHLYSISYPRSLPIVIFNLCHPPILNSCISPVRTSRVICHPYHLINPVIGCPLIGSVSLSYTLMPNTDTHTHTSHLVSGLSRCSGIKRTVRL